MDAAEQNWWRCPAGHRLVETDRGLVDGQVRVTYAPCGLCGPRPDLTGLAWRWAMRQRGRR